MLQKAHRTRFLLVNNRQTFVCGEHHAVSPLESTSLSYQNTTEYHILQRPLVGEIDTRTTLRAFDWKRTNTHEMAKQDQWVKFGILSQATRVLMDMN